MDQNQLLDRAKKRLGLTTDLALARRLQVRASRLSEIRNGSLPADAYEVFRLAEWAEVDPLLAFAAVRKERDRNPVKKAFWENVLSRRENLPRLEDQ